MSIQYSSIYVQDSGIGVVDKAEDLYAMGISMWEIYTGQIPLLT